MKAAIIGIGAIAKMHAMAIRDIEGVELVGATCRTEAKGRAFEAEFGCPWHADTAALLAATKPALFPSPRRREPIARRCSRRSMPACM